MTEGEPPVRRDSLLAQFIGTSGGEAANRLAQLGSVALAGWTLGVTGLGIIGIAWSLTTIAQALTIGGPELIGIRTLVRAAANRDGSEAPPARPRARSQGRGCARPASEGATDVSTSKAIMIPASPDPGTSPVSGRDGGPASSWTRSQGRGCARPASEGSLDESPSRLEGIIAEVTRLKLYLAMAAAPVLILAGLILGHGNPAIVTQVAVQTCAMVIVTLGYAWALRGLWRAVEQGVIRTVQAGGMLVLLWGLLAVWPSPLAVPVAEAVSAALALAVARHRLGRLAQGTVPIHSSIRPLLGPSLRVGLATLLSISVWQTPVLIAALWVSVEQVSYLTGTMRLLLGLCGLLQMALQAIYPALADRYAIDPPRARVATLSLVLLAVAVAVMGTAILMACADWLAPLLLGPDFVAVGPLLRWLLPLLIPVAIVSPMLYGLIAMGHTKDIVYLQGGALVAVVPCCVLAFWALPSAWSALVLHPVIWGQAIVISVVAWRRGVIPAGFAVCFQGTAPAAAARLPVSAKVTR